MVIPKRCHGWAAFAATACARWVSSTSANRVRSASSTGTMALTSTRSLLPPRGSAVDRYATAFSEFLAAHQPRSSRAPAHLARDPLLRGLAPRAATWRRFASLSREDVHLRRRGSWPLASGDPAPGVAGAVVELLLNL